MQGCQPFKVFLVEKNLYKVGNLFDNLDDFQQ